MEYYIEKSSFELLFNALEKRVFEKKEVFYYSDSQITTTCLWLSVSCAVNNLFNALDKIGFYDYSESQLVEIPASLDTFIYNSIYRSPGFNVIESAVAAGVLIKYFCDQSTFDESENKTFGVYRFHTVKLSNYVY